MTPLNYVTSTNTPDSTIQMMDVVVAIGGSSNAVHEARTFALNAMGLSFDNLNDLAQLELYFRELGVEVYAMAESETMSSLFAGSNHPAAPTIESISDSVATTGVGGAPAAGNQAGMLTVKSDSFESFANRLRDQIVQRSNGAPCGIRLWISGSMSGGTAAGSLGVFGEILAKILSGLGVPVELHYCVIGQIGYTGISDVSSLNAPCVLTSLVNLVTSKAPDKVVRHLHLTEVPTLGINGEQLRNQLIALDHQALNANATKRTIERDAPNKATTNAIGNIDARTAKFHFSPESALALSASAAKQVLYLWRKLAEFPRHDPSLIRDLDWIGTPIPVDSESIEEILENYRRDSKAMCDLIVLPTELKEFRLIANLRSIGQLDMCQIDHQFATEWKSETDIRQRQILLATFDHFLSRELRSNAQRLANLTSTIDGALPSIDKYLRAYYRTTRQLVRDRAMLKLSELLRDIRKLANRRAIVEEQHKALRISHSMVMAEVGEMKRVSSEVENALAHCLSSIGPGVTEDLVVPKTLTDCLPHLMAMMNLSEQRKIKRLNHLMGPITRAGLQLIVGSKTARFESIAYSIVYGKPTHVSPPLGAKATTKSGPAYYVLPQMEAKEGELLAEAILKLDPNGLVFFCDSNGCGAAVVIFNFQRFTDVESLFPGILKSDLARALGSKNFQLRFPNGTSHLGRLGIHYDPMTRTVSFKPVDLIRN